MNTLTKLALGMIGQLKLEPAEAYAASRLPLPPAQTSGGLPLMLALQRRQSQREFDPAPLPLQTLSDLLWATAGVNRPELGGRTAPSAMNAQEVDQYVAHHEQLQLVPVAQRVSYAWLAAGAMSQNAYLYCASVGLSTVIRAWIDRSALGQAMALSADEQVLVAQTVGLPAAAGAV